MTKMNVTGYSFDPIDNVLVCSTSFLKKASQLNTPEYSVLTQFRAEVPSLRIEKNEKKNIKRPLNITFAKMEEYIRQCRDSETRLEQFSKVKSISKIQASPYQYVRTWFLDNYANYSEQPTFDAAGFVVVKTKHEMESEREAHDDANPKKIQTLKATENVSDEDGLDKIASQRL